MKTKNIKSIVAVALASLAIVSCKQDAVTLKPQPGPAAPTGTKGNADFTKYVSIGNSLTAGFQAGALFTEGQQNSLPMILSKQFSYAQGTTLAFNQPDIGSVNGYNSTYSNIGGGIIRGRLVLYAADGVQAHALPTPAGSSGVPAPYNTADAPAAYGGDKSKLNNFGVPGIILAQFLTPDTGNPAKAAYNPLWARFASQPGVKSILDDVVAAQPTFFTFDLGNNDVLGYATTGGDTDTGGARLFLTPNATFTGYYTTAIGALMANTNAKGVVVTIPDVTSIPFFTTVTWNAIPLDANTAAYVQANLAANYNAFLTAMKNNGIITDGELAKRTLTYVAGQNPILITDETLTDLTPYMNASAPALLPYFKARQTTSADLVPLTAGSKLGTLANPNDPTTVYGVAVPMADKYILIKQEVDSIKASTASFNATIASVASNYSTRIAVADVNATFNAFVAAGAMFSTNVLIQPTFKPPYGAFSEDGVHPNSRGYAFMANIIIDALNAKFTATVPKANLGDYKGTGLPLGPNGTIWP